ncbi:ribosomal L28 family-domain-containing protein [Lipomyces kononenkoae]
MPLLRSVQTAPIVRSRIMLTLAPYRSRTFSASATVAAREFKYVVSRRVKQQPAKKTNFWVKQHLKTFRKIKYPPYPYGDSTIFKRSNRGLYGGKFPMRGHSVSSELKKKNLRRWLPNANKTTLYSAVLKKRIRLQVVASVMKTIKKEGGLDNYLIKDKPARIKELGPRGWRLRYAVMLRLKEQEAKSLRGR